MNTPAATNASPITSRCALVELGKRGSPPAKSDPKPAEAPRRTSRAAVREACGRASPCPGAVRADARLRGRSHPAQLDTERPDLPGAFPSLYTRPLT